MDFIGLLDMIDGGGAGAAGDKFQGGAFSELLNAIGVRPRGYNDRMQGMQDTRPQMRPPMPTPATRSAPQAQPSGMTPGTGYVGNTGYSPPPMGNLTPGSMTLPDLMTMQQMGRAANAGQAFEQFGMPQGQQYPALSQEIMEYLRANGGLLK